MQQNGTYETPFSNKTLFWLIMVGLLATMGVAITSVFEGDGRYETSMGANSFSKSAIGHAALVEILKQDGWTIVQSQHNTAEKLGDGSALLIMEPRAGTVTSTRLEELLDYVPALLVLPKRSGVPHSYKQGWIGQQSVMGANIPTQVLGYVAAEAELVRPDKTPEDWQSPIFAQQTPDISNIQLMKSDKIEPVIWTEEGTLLGKIERENGVPLWVLSDPDILATHGLNRGWNADFSVGIIQTLAPDADTLVIDEVIHGFTVDPSLAKAMFRKPFLFATVAFLLALTVFLLALTRRFGAPYRHRIESRDSKAVFVENSARILAQANKEQEALLRLFEDTALTVARQLNVPHDLERQRLETWLDERAHSKGIVPDYSTLKRRLQRIREDDDTRQHRLLIISNQFYTWKREMLSDSK